MDYSIELSRQAATHNSSQQLDSAAIVEHVENSLRAEIDRRVALINDPKEIIEDLELENFSFSHLEESFKGLLSRLNINLP